MKLLIILGIIGPTELIMLLIIPVVLIFLLRALGAWLFRIDEVIKLQKQILEELKRKNDEK